MEDIAAQGGAVYRMDAEEYLGYYGALSAAARARMVVHRKNL